MIRTQYLIGRRNSVESEIELLNVNPRNMNSYVVSDLSQATIFDDREKTLGIVKALNLFAQALGTEFEHFMKEEQVQSKLFDEDGVEVDLVPDEGETE